MDASKRKKRTDGKKERTKIKEERNRQKERGKNWKREERDEIQLRGSK